MVVVIGFRHKQNNALCIKTKVLLLFGNSLQRCEYLADRPTDYDDDEFWE